jgi:hypothetical protein
MNSSVTNYNYDSLDRTGTAPTPVESQNRKPDPALFSRFVFSPNSPTKNALVVGFGVGGKGGSAGNTRPRQ